MNYSTSWMPGGNLRYNLRHITVTVHIHGFPSQTRANWQDVGIIFPTFFDHLRKVFLIEKFTSKQFTRQWKQLPNFKMKPGIVPSQFCKPHWLIEWQTYQWAHRGMDRQTDEITDGLTKQLTEWMTDRPTDPQIKVYIHAKWPIRTEQTGIELILISEAWSN